MLKITKKGDKYWLFEDSEIGLFSPSKFTINFLNNLITIVYENGLKSKNYNVSDCEIYDLGATNPFTTSSGNAFMQKLEELNCPCFQKNENIYNISGGAWGDITGNLSNQTDLQTALDSKLNKDTAAGVERAYIINADGSQGTKATSDFISPTQLLEDFYNKSAKAIIEWIPFISIWGNAIAPTVTGTANNVAPLFIGGSTYFQAQFRRRYASAGTAGSSTSYRDSNFRHTAIGEGFISYFIFGNEDAVNVAQARSACGFIGGNGEIGNVNPSTTTNFIGVANDSGQANLHFNVSNSSSLSHNIDLGSSFPANTNSTDFYLLIMINDKGVSNLKWRVVNLHSGADTGYSTITTGLPAYTIGLSPQIWRNNGSTALAVMNSIMLYRLLKM